MKFKTNALISGEHWKWV